MDDGEAVSGPEFAAAVVGELQSVLEQACAALQAQQEGHPDDALQGYFLARSRVHYVTQALLHPLAEGGDTEAALAQATCALLQDTYTAAIDRLSLCSSGHDQSPLGAAAHGSAASDETEEGPLGGWGGPGSCWGDGAAGGNRQARRGADAGLLEARGPAGGGGAGGKEQRQLADAGRECLREVSGSLEEVVGLRAIKQELREAVLLPMRFPHLFTGIRRPQCNLVFYGVPGTGKTLLVEKLAAEAGTPLLCVSPSAILSKWAGESEKTLRAVFEAAAAASPAIIFIDEVDSLAPTRSSGDDLAARRVLTELLIQMTAATNRPDRPVWVLAATNRLQDCDPALLRRFDRKIEVPPPDAEARASFFAATVARPEVGSHLSDVELARLSAATEGCTGSDLAAVCREAAMAPVREMLTGCYAGGSGGAAAWGGTGGMPSLQDRPRPLCCQDFLEAVAKLAPPASTG